MSLLSDALKGGTEAMAWCAAGVYYKGVVISVRGPPPLTAPLEEREAYDPWESVRVEWDASKGHAEGEVEDVSPWEIERDPEHEAAEAAAAAAAAAEAAAEAARNQPPPPPPPVVEPPPLAWR